MANNAQLARNLYTEFEEQLFLGDRLTSSEFATLMNPGQFVNPDLREGDATDDMQIQAGLVDECLNTSFLYQPLSGMISERYGEALEFAALPRSSLTADLEREMREIRDWQRRNEVAYSEYRDRYFDALDAYEAERRMPAPSGSRLQRLKQKKDDALDAWINRGFKRDWENRQARLVQILAGNPEAYWNDLRRRVDEHRRTSPNRGDYLQTFLVPRVVDWNAASWAAYERSINDQRTSNESRTTSWSGGASFGFDFWSFGGGVSHSSTYQHTEAEVSSVDVSFEYLRVRIDRPWLVSSIFGARFWTWKSSHGFHYLSDGGKLQASPPIRPVGTMPVLPTHMIVARNVRLAAHYSDAERTFVQTQTRARAGFGFGCFRIGGSYSRSTTSEYTHGHEDNGVVTIPQPQIIAFLGKLLPRTPDPIRTLPWGDDAVFEETAPEVHRNLLAAERSADREALLHESQVLADLRAHMLDFDRVAATRRLAPFMPAPRGTGSNRLESWLL